MTDTFKDRIELLDKALSDKFKYHHGTAGRAVEVTENIRIIVYANKRLSLRDSDEFSAVAEMKNLSPDKHIEFWASGDTPHAALNFVLDDLHEALGKKVIDVDDLLTKKRKGNIDGGGAQIIDLSRFFLNARKQS